MICQSIINSCFSPNSFSYLEIGIGTKNPYNSINTKNKICVDIDGRADYNNGSDDFFQNYKGDKFDVIFVDGDHHSEQVIKDYNNSIKILNQNGLIFIHDLLPPDLKHCGQDSCGDGYQLLNYFVDNNYNYLTIPQDFGLTLLYGELKPVINVINSTYEDLISKKINLTSIEEVIRFIQDKKYET
jgi:hypothetical protein